MKVIIAMSSKTMHSIDHNEGLKSALPTMLWSTELKYVCVYFCVTHKMA